ARFRIRAGRYRGVESAPKTLGSVRDVDCLPPVVEALRAQKAQQAAARLKAGQGAAEPGQDYVFTGPEGGLLNVSNLRDHAWYGTLKKAELRRRTMYQTRTPSRATRSQLARPRRDRRDVGPRHAGDAIQCLRAIHPESSGETAARC